MQKLEPSIKILCKEASLLTQINIEGGSKDKEVTDVAVIACLCPYAEAEITLTVDVIPLIDFRKFFFVSESCI